MWGNNSYPAVYTLTILPIAIVRFRAFHDEHVPFAYTVVADVLFVCSGFFNVCLFGFTRPALMPRRDTLASSGQSLNPLTFSLRSPTVDHPFSARPSMIPPRSPMAPMTAVTTPITALPDDSVIYRFDSRSEHDYDVHSFQPSPVKTGKTPSLVSFRTGPNSSD